MRMSRLSLEQHHQFKSLYVQPEEFEWQFWRLNDPIVIDCRQLCHECQPHEFIGAFSGKGGYECREGEGLLTMPGLELTLALIHLACGSERNKFVMASTAKAEYAKWGQCFTNFQYNLPLDGDFRFSVVDIRPGTKLLMANYPCQFSGQTVTADWWRQICNHCQVHGIRLFNDASLAILAHDAESSTLGDVAQEFPDLSWIESYWVPGLSWKAGVAQGSTDFIEDLVMIKKLRNLTDPPLAYTGIQASHDNRPLYRQRLDLLIGILKDAGIDIANEPRAGSGVLCKVPSVTVEGKRVEGAAAFNDWLAKESGIVGLPSGNLIKYSVAKAPVENDQWQEALRQGFAKINDLR